LYRFVSGSNDWEFLYDCVPEKLRELHEDGYRVVFFTNQAGIEKDKVKPQSVKDKVEAIIKELGIPVVVSACTLHRYVVILTQSSCTVHRLPLTATSYAASFYMQ
jgi:bifunctional polynucleotide phosphatase/kinase